MIYLERLAAAFNVLGTCYLFSPDDETVKPSLTFLGSSELVSQWPCEVNQSLALSLSEALNANKNQLKEEWNILFIGPSVLPAPPWGSVYLDPEGVLQGCSTIALNEFLKREKISVRTQNPEPVDHIGLMLFQAAYLASQARENALKELLEKHLNTWLPHYFKRLQRANASQFYTALTELTLLTTSNVLNVE